MVSAEGRHRGQFGGEAITFILWCFLPLTLLFSIHSWTASWTNFLRKQLLWSENKKTLHLCFHIYALFLRTDMLDYSLKDICFFVLQSIKRARYALCVHVFFLWRVTPGPVTPQPLTCGVDHFQCVYSFQCIPRSWLCDGEPDCADRSDEEHCPALVPGTLPPQGQCRTGYFQCSSSLCLPTILRCDGVPDCPVGEDENSCRKCLSSSSMILFN